MYVRTYVRKLKPISSKFQLVTLRSCTDSLSAQSNFADEKATAAAMAAAAAAAAVAVAAAAAVARPRGGLQSKIGPGLSIERT